MTLTADDIRFDEEPTSFRIEHGRYTFTVLDGTLDFVADRLRRERWEPWREFDVRCELKGVRTTNGSLNIGSFNFSSPSARKQRAGSNVRKHKNLFTKISGTDGVTRIALVDRRAS